MLKLIKPYRPTLRATAMAAILTLTLAACSGSKWGFPYKPNIQQGNWVTSQQIEQLQQGMSREQVQYLLGSPTLQNVFRDNRWDYPYYNKPGYGEPQKRLFTVWFDGNFLTHWEGDDHPSTQPFEKSDTGQNISESDTTTQPIN